MQSTCQSSLSATLQPVEIGRTRSFPLTPLRRIVHTSVKKINPTDVKARQLGDLDFEVGVKDFFTPKVHNECTIEDDINSKL